MACMHACRIFDYTFVIGFYIALAIGTPNKTAEVFKERFVPWPDW